MPSLLPSCVIPETVKTSYIIIDSYEDKQMKGVFANLNMMNNIVFGSAMELLFEVDAMLESCLSSIADGSF